MAAACRIGGRGGKRCKCLEDWEEGEDRGGAGCIVVPVSIHVIINCIMGWRIGREGRTEAALEAS